MISLSQLWLPIVLGSVAVFIVSSLVHMVFRWHKADYQKLANEDEVRAVMRKGPAAPGQYVVPHCPDMKQMQTPEMQQKFKEGPVALMWVRPNGLGPMGAMLGQWFGLSAVISVLAAYIAAHTLGAGADPMNVLRVISTIGFMAYGAGSVSDGIWMGKPWRAVAKDMLDALLYGFATAAPFALMWPKA